MKSELKVKVVDITEDGIDVNDYLDAEFIGLTEKDHLHFITPLTVKARLQLVGETVLAKVNVAGRFASQCYRSLLPVERNWSVAFMLDYPLDPNAQYLDLAEDIRQEIILELPIRVLSDAEEAKDQRVERLKEDLQSPDDDLPDTYQPFKNI